VAPRGADKASDPSTGEVVSDLWQLVRDYAKQETIDPLKTIGRFLLWGVLGAVLLSLGMLFGSLALLRGLQVETGTRFTGSLNVVPYAITFLVMVAVTGLSVRAVTKPNRETKAS
jgi:hypothetical protein